MLGLFLNWFFFFPSYPIVSFSFSLKRNCGSTVPRLLQIDEVISFAKPFFFSCAFIELIKYNAVKQQCSIQDGVQQRGGMHAFLLSTPERSYVLGSRSKKEVCAKSASFIVYMLQNINYASFFFSFFSFFSRHKAGVMPFLKLLKRKR